MEKLRLRVEEKVSKTFSDHLTEIIDLEVEEAPETLLIASVTGANHNSSGINSMRFLWEVYKLSLDLLKTNGKMVAAYKDSALSAINFCEKYKRVTECRKLSVILRTHLHNIFKFQNNTASNSLTYMMKLDDDTLKNLIPIRERLMTVCMNLNLWQEAFRAAEDTRLLICEGKALPSTLAKYWLSLSTIFWKAKQNLFHAYSMYLYYYQNKKYNKKFVNDSKLVNSIVLATLAVPTYNLGRDITGTITETILSQEINAKLSTMLIQSGMVTREQLIELLHTNNLLELASKEIRDLFLLLENQFLPLTLSHLAKPLIEKIRETPDFNIYISAIEQLMVGRVLAQLSTCYKSIRLETLYNLIDFIEKDTLEKYILDVSIKTSLKIKIDQSNNAIFFEDTVESSTKQSQISKVAENLFQAANSISKSKNSENRKKIMEIVFSDLENILNKALELRQNLTDDGKKINKERDEVMRKKMEEDKKMKEFEKRKIDEEAKQREKTIKLTTGLNDIEKEKRHINLTAIKSIIDKMKSFGFSSKEMAFQGKKIDKMTEDEHLEIGPEEFVKLFGRLYEKSVKDRQIQVKNMQKALEYNERAKREYMNPLIIQKWAESTQTEIDSKKTLLKEKFEKDLASKKQFERMKNFKAEYISTETTKAKVIFERVYSDWNEKMREHYKKEIAQVARKKRDDEKKLREEEIKKAKEENERRLKADEARSKEIGKDPRGWRGVEVQKKFSSNRPQVESGPKVFRRTEAPQPVEEKKVESGGPPKRFFNSKKQEKDNEGFTKVTRDTTHG